MFRIQNIRYFSLLLLLVVSALSYHPIFANVVINDEGTNPLSRYILLLTILAFILHFDYNKWIKQRFLRKFMIYAIIIIVIGFLLQQIQISNKYFVEARNIVISFVFLAIGYNSKMTVKRLGWAILVFSLTIGYTTYLQLIQHAGGFVITNQYISYGKNIMGVMCVSACLALVIFAKESEKVIIRIFLWVVSIFLFILTVSIRARGSYLSLLLVVIFIIYKILKQGNKNIERLSKYVFLGFGIFIAFLLFTDAFYSFGDFFMASLYQNRESDIMTGRGSINEYAYSFFLKNPIFGALSEDINMSSLIHNFLLRQLASFGILGAFPIAVLYLFIVVYVIKVTLKNRVNIVNIGFFVFLIQIIMSMEEPTFPFAPGTGVLFSYILLGYSLSQRELLITQYQ